MEKISVRNKNWNAKDYKVARTELIIVYQVIKLFKRWNANDKSKRWLIPMRGELAQYSNYMN